MGPQNRNISCVLIGKQAILKSHTGTRWTDVCVSGHTGQSVGALVSVVAGNQQRRTYAHICSYMKIQLWNFKENVRASFPTKSH